MEAIKLSEIKHLWDADLSSDPLILEALEKCTGHADENGSTLSDFNLPEHRETPIVSVWAFDWIAVWRTKRGGTIFIYPI